MIIQIKYSKEEEKIEKIMYLRVFLDDLVDELFEFLVDWLLKVVVVENRHLDNKKCINIFD